MIKQKWPQIYNITLTRPSWDLPSAGSMYINFLPSNMIPLNPWQVDITTELPSRPLTVPQYWQMFSSWKKIIILHVCEGAWSRHISACGKLIIFKVSEVSISLQETVKKFIFFLKLYCYVLELKWRDSPLCWVYEEQSFHLSGSWQRDRLRPRGRSAEGPAHNLPPY